MIQVVVDDSVRAKLTVLNRPAQVCDRAGNILGRFVPQLDPSKHVLEPQVSDEELQRRSQSKKTTYSTEEVLDYLERL